MLPHRETQQETCRRKARIWNAETTIASRSRASQRATWVGNGPTGLAGAFLIAGALGLVACDPLEAEPKVCDQVPVCFDSTDGCNHCCYYDRSGWGCTEEWCIYHFSAGRACYPFPCVADVDAEEPGLQYDCRVEAGIEGGAISHDVLPECELTDGEPSVPEGADACYRVHVGDARSPSCVDEEYALEFEYVYAGEPPEGWFATPHCEYVEFRDWIEGRADCHGPGPSLHRGVHAPPCEEQ